MIEPYPKNRYNYYRERVRTINIPSNQLNIKTDILYTVELFDHINLYHY